jgi:hypothetical protein
LEIGSSTMAELLAKLRFPTILLFGGFALLLASASSKLDLKAWSFEGRSEVGWPLFVIGLILCSLALVVFLIQEGLISTGFRGRTRKTAGGFEGCIGRSRVALHFGRLEQVAPTDGQSRDLIVLPTNEFFDEDCLKAQGTACGAYLAAKAPRNLEKLKDEIVRARAGLKPIGQFEKRAGATETSYGTGVCISIDDPTGIPHPLLLASVATKRADTGFQADPAAVFRCLDSMARKATDERISSVYMPLLGAGKGGLTPEASLITMLLAISTLQRRLGGFDTAINIVIFRAGPGAEADVKPTQARRLLSLAVSMHASAREGR